MGRSSILGQIGFIFKSLDRIGESKKDWKEEKIAPNGSRYQASNYLHNHDYLEKKLKEAKNFGRWVREEFGVKSIYQLQPEHHQAYVNHHQQLGNSLGHIANIESTLGIIQRGMNLHSQSRGLEPVQWFEKRLVSNEKSPENRAYTPNELEKIRANLSRQAQKAMDLSQRLGLRSREACNIRVEHFIRTENGQMKVYIPSKKEAMEKGLTITTAAGITKGGRSREIPVPKDFQEQVEGMIKGLNSKDRLVNIKENSLRQALSRACKKAGIKSQGWHGFRHTFARNRLDELFEKTGMGADCRDALLKMLENRAEGQKIDKGFEGKFEKEVFETTKNCLNIVTGELGHGADRWELIETYMQS